MQLLRLAETHCNVLASGVFVVLRFIRITSCLRWYDAVLQTFSSNDYISVSVKLNCLLFMWVDFVVKSYGGNAEGECEE